jgi:beta-lactamase regulating signal transducer with metallopeptidase domain
MAAYFAELLTGSTREILAFDVAAKATLVLAGAGAVAIVLRSASAASRHLCWCLGLSAVLVLPALSLALPQWSCRVLPTATETVGLIPASTDLQAPHPAPPGVAPRSLDGIGFDEDPLRDSGSAGRPASRPDTARPAAQRGRSWVLFNPSWSWLWAAWLVGATTVLSAPIAGGIALRRWAREAEPIVGEDWTALLLGLSAQLGLTGHIRLLRSTRAVMPMTWGWIRPVVLLPAESESWDVDRRRDVLLHELAHVRRLDCLTQIIARAACAVYWFHPLAWFAERRLRIERERACDDVVLLSGARASDYAGHLLEIARGLNVPRAVAQSALAMARPPQLEGRLVAILDPARRRRRGPGRGVAAAALIAVAVAIGPLATVQLGTRANTGSAPTVVAPSANVPPETARVERMTLTGRVLDPAGKPVPDAAVMVIVRSKYSRRPQLDAAATGAMSSHEGRCDGSGRFRIELPRTTSARQHGLTLTAMASGYSLGWTDLDPDVDPPVADVALRPELVIRGRMFDVQGQPARGVALRVESLIPVVRGALTGSIFRPDADELRRRDFAAWPGPAISDEQGGFTLRGLSRDLLCWLLVEDPRFAIPFTVIQTAEKVDARQPVPLYSTIKVDPGPDPKPITLTLQPAQTVVGRVTYADTGQPVPRALVSSGRRGFEADADGRFRVTTGPARANRFGVRAQSPDGPPYLMAMKQGEWPQGAIEQSVDVSLPRGVVVHGKITEERTGRPVVGAVVRVTGHESAGRVPPSLSIPAATGPDGTYRVAAPPGAGYVVVQGPGDDYVLREFGAEGGLYVAQPGRRRFYAHAYRAIDLKPDAPDQEVDLTLRPGRAIRGRAVGPDGQPVQDAWVCSQLMVWTVPNGGWKIWVTPQDHSRSQLRDGRFVLHGLDPNSAVKVPAFFLEPFRKLGAVVKFSGGSAANGPVTVRLEPCGTARARLVTSEGKPLDRYPARALVVLVVTPGPMRGRNMAKDGPLLANEAGLVQLDSVNYSFDFQSDADGRITLPALIPGATYRIEDISPLFGGGDPVIRKEFTVKPGETLDLGDILIAKPRRGG